MIVGSWPGYVSTQNSFLQVFLDGLAEAGCAIESVDSIDQLKDVGHLDVLFLHWPQRVFWEADSRPGAVANMIKLVRLLRRHSPDCKIVWLAHDLRPHDARGLQSILWKPFMAALLSAVDAVLTLSKATVEPVVDAYPALAGRPIGATRHPAYPNQSLSANEHSGIRAELGFEAHHRVVGYCGQLRRNKGLDKLVETYRNVGPGQHRLLVAGHAPGTSSDLVQQLRRAETDDTGITVVVEDLSAERYRRLVGACDLVVAPFNDYLHSGSLVHALSADRPVLTPCTPFAQGLADDVGTQCVRLYDGALQSEILLEALKVAEPAGSCPLDLYRPQQVGVDVLDWLRNEVGQSGSVASGTGGR